MSTNEPVVSSGTTTHTDTDEGGFFKRFETSIHDRFETIKGDWRSGHHTKAALEAVVLPQMASEHVVESYAHDAAQGTLAVAKKALPVINEEVLLFGGLALAAGLIVLAGMKQVNSTIDKII